MLLGQCGDPCSTGPLFMDVWPGCKHVSMLRINFNLNRVNDKAVKAIVDQASGAFVPCSAQQQATA